MPKKSLAFFQAKELIELADIILNFSPFPTSSHQLITAKLNT